MLNLAINRFGFQANIQSMNRWFFFIIGFSLFIIVLFSALCFHTNQCSWSKQQEPSQIYWHVWPTSQRSLEYGNLMSQSCEPIHPTVVFYNRIFKTASSTMSSFLKRCSIVLGNIYTRDYTEEWENENVSHPVLERIQSKIVDSKRRNKRLMAIAHLYFRENVNSSYINLMREPVARFISHYYYCRSSDRWPKKLKRIKELGQYNVTIEECLEKQYEGCVWNHMTRFFCGPHAFCKTGSAEALARAKHNMVHYYAVVGVVEYLDKFVEVLNKRLPDFVLPLPKEGMRRNFVTKGVKRTPLHEVTMQRIEEVNKADIELYEFAKDLFFKQATNCGLEIKM